MSRVIVSMSVLVFAAASFLSAAAGAQSFLDPNASAAEVKRALQGTRSISRRPAPQVSSAKPSGAAQARPRSGGWSAGGAAAGGARAAQPLPPSEGDVEAGPASFRIQFALSSATLRREAIPLLDKLGEALNSEELNDWVFVVEGHTDASGDEQFNLDLSQRRAEAVRDYLVSKHGVEPARLPVRGYGESKLYDADRPAAPVNRRVTFAKPELQADAAAADVASQAAGATPLSAAPSGMQGDGAMADDEVRLNSGAEGGHSPRDADKETIIQTGPADILSE